jgi:hypothetical protein
MFVVGIFVVGVSAGAAAVVESVSSGASEPAGSESATALGAVALGP